MPAPDRPARRISRPFRSRSSDPGRSDEENLRAIPGELTDTEVGRASGRVPKAWNDLDLMDDQP
ncbi:hypothetical protein ACGF8B_38155 [Streptomyces sp. NPDC047917]|uniref:hypothetical protein n=1 Tax=Streptomyces sp. NPDC047917 TaxID=3365491 RepID=UPI003717849D